MGSTDEVDEDEFEHEEAARRARHAGMFAIGQFSRITGLSIKTLRLYHEKELLPPSWIDGDSGYRYYNENDVERARVIADLKTLELSLSDIKDLLDGYDDRGALAFLEAQRQRIEERRAQLTRVAGTLDRLIRTERELAELACTAPREVTQVELTPCLVAGLRWRGTYAETGRMLGRVYRQYGRQTSGPPLNLYYEEEYKDEGADIESCVPVRGGREASGFTLHTLPAQRALALVHRGPYSDLCRSYARLMRRFEELRLEPGLPIREIYRKGPGMIFKGDPHNYLTELQIPVAAPA